MCRFKPLDTNITYEVYKFQYILCVGSRKNPLPLSLAKKSFNTSYVSVQVLSFSENCSISLFQYILCVGSSL